MNPYQAPSVDVGDRHTVADGTFFRRALAGGYPLWRVFWLLFVPAPLILYVITILLMIWVPGWLGLQIYWKYLTVAVFLTNTLCMATLGLIVSRCASNSSYRIFGFLARLSVVTYLLWYGNKMMASFAVLYYS